jgi:hypothetical protein
MGAGFLSTNTMGWIKKPVVCNIYEGALKVPVGLV